jgi:prevent-host-death family protein
MALEEIAISKFKATCLAVLKRVRRTGQPIRVTRFGEPVAEIVPPSPAARPEGWLGCMSGTAAIEGDIVSSVLEPEEWEALR